MHSLLLVALLGGVASPFAPSVPVRVRHLVASSALDRSPQGATRQGKGIVGRWRITSGVRAPWLAAGERADTVGLAGRTLRFRTSRVDGPHPLGCAHARYERSMVEPEGLFQGNLPAPAAERARALGLRASRVPTVSLACDAGLFEYHRLGSDTLLLALDNVIWTIVRVPAGARATPR